MFIPALHTLQTSTPHGIEESHDVLCGMACHSSWRATVSSSRFFGGGGGGWGWWCCLASWPYHRAMPTRFQLGWCQGTLQASPSHQSQHQRGMLCKLWQWVVECCHAETSLPVDGSAWMAPLFVTGFRLCTALHWGSPGSQQDQYNAIQKSHPTPWEMHPLHICLFSLMHGSANLSFLLFHTLSPPSTLSRMNQLSYDIRIWFWIWFWIWIWSFISRGTKAKWQDLEARCLGGQHSCLQHWQKCDFGFLTVFIKRPVTHWWVGPHS